VAFQRYWPNLDASGAIQIDQLLGQGATPMPPPLAETAPRLSPRDTVHRFRDLLVPQTGRANGDVLMSLPSGIHFELNNYLCNNPLYGGRTRRSSSKTSC